jgi:tetratricopeptide (TPR) repeat protein
VAQRTAKQWAINIVLIIVTLSFLGISIAPLLGGILAPQQPATNATAPTNEKDRIKIQIEGFEAVLKSEPKNRTALEGLVNLRLALGEVKATVEPLQLLAEAYPEITGYRLVLANTYIKLKDREKAAAEYRKVLTTQPGNLEAIQLLVNLELENKRPEAAIGVLEDAIEKADTVNKIQPGSVDKSDLNWVLGEQYRKQKRYSEAIATYNKIAKANAKDFRPLLGKAQIERAKGDEAKAKALFAEAVNLAPAQFKDDINKIAAGSPTEATETTPKTSTPDSKDKSENKPENKSESKTLDQKN